MNRSVSLIGSFGLAAALLLALVVLSEIDFRSLWQQVVQAHPGYLLLIVAAKAVIFALSAVKWKLINERVTAEPSSAPRLFFYYTYTCLGGLLGQILPPHISSIAARSVGLRLHHKAPMLQGASTSLIEQVFDVLLPAACIGASLLFVIGLVSYNVFLLLVIVSIILVGGMIVWFGPQAAQWIGRREFTGGVISTRFVALRSALQHYSDQLDRRLMTQLYLLSAVRFALLAAQAALIVHATGLAVAVSDVLASLPLVQLSLLIAITPASIGIAEWTWSSLLYALGTSLTLASNYALLYRLLGAGAILLVTLVVWFFAMLGRVIRSPGVEAA